MDAFVLDAMTQVDRIEARMRRHRRQLEELVADAAHGHITVERMKSLGSVVAREQLGLEDELAAAKGRVAAQHSEVERSRHLDEARAELVANWDTMPFEQKQAAVREVVDRIEVDGAECRLYLRH